MYSVNSGAFMGGWEELEPPQPNFLCHTPWYSLINILINIKSTIVSSSDQLSGINFNYLIQIAKTHSRGPRI